MTTIQDAIKQIGTTKTAVALGIKKPSVSKFIKGTRPVPKRHIPKLASLHGCTPEQLCSDVTWNRNEQGRVISYTVAIEDDA